MTRGLLRYARNDVCTRNDVYARNNERSSNDERKLSVEMPWPPPAMATAAPTLPFGWLADFKRADQ